MTTEHTSPTGASLDRERFARDGFIVRRGLLPPAEVEELRAITAAALDPLAAPVEYEADVGYPGAPSGRGSLGGDTPRRLLFAFGRDAAYRRWATGTRVARVLEEISGANDWQLSQCHHNCVMTKAPGYSSETQWHQDIRYWSFDQPELISVWLALGDENDRNGALRLIPGSHALSIDRGRLDRDLFLRQELEENRALIEQAQTVTLARGDALFFHCRAFHAAGRNRSTETKLSCVFTYHRVDNRPIPGTRSAAFESVPVAPARASSELTAASTDSPAGGRDGR
ncbi:MAG: phytanoyl-CoA dioxygenase family protein [Pseudomonadota bacterium]